jgi:Peptidase family M48
LPESAAIGYFTVIPSLRRLTDFVERRLFLMTKSLIKNGGRPARRRGRTRAGRGMLGAAYSREAEAGADRFAVAVMKSLGRSPKALGGFLLRISGPEKDNPLAIFASHPMTEERLSRFEAESNESIGAPWLAFGEWQALQAICK